MDYRKRAFLSFVLIFTIVLTNCTRQTMQDNDNNTLVIAVSIIPQKTFVNKVAGSLADVIVMIPPGYSPSNYQPSLKNMEKLSKASLYFSIGVPAEQSGILPRLKSINNTIHITNLAEEVDKIYPHRYFNTSLSCGKIKETSTGLHDPHIWMSPRRVIIMVKRIAYELGEIDSKNKETYLKNALSYIDKLEKLDQEINNILKDVNSKTFIIYHPALGYFADDYNLEMIEVQESGKKVTTRKLQTIIDTAREKNIKTIFYQAEIGNAQSQVIADEICGKIMQISPLAPNYIQNMQTIAKTLKNVLQ